MPAIRASNSASSSRSQQNSSFPQQLLTLVNGPHRGQWRKEFLGTGLWMSNELLEAKAREVDARGLMTYPADSPDDVLRIEGIAALLACATQPLQLRLPHCSVKVSFDPRLPPQLLYYLTVGDYEQSDLHIANQYVTRGDIVMEIGAGIGITGCALALASGNAAILVEANPHLWSHIEANFALNSVGLTLVRGAAVASGYRDPKVTFHIQPNYWWSSLVPEASAKTLEADAFKLSDLVARYQPTTLVFDIEGAEAFVLNEPLAHCVKKVFIEIHTPTLGTRTTATFVARFEDMGFRLRDIRALTWVFTRL